RVASDLDPDLEWMELPDSLRDYGTRLYQAPSAGTPAALPVIAVCAAAGVITSVIAKTGLGQILSEVLVAAAEAVSLNKASLIGLSALFSGGQRGLRGVDDSRRHLRPVRGHP